MKEGLKEGLNPYSISIHMKKHSLNRQHDLQTASILLSYAPPLLSQHQGPFACIPLHEAVRLQHESMVRLFLKVMPSLVNVCDKYGWCSAHYALYMNSWKILTLLLNVRETLSDAVICDLRNACKLEIERGGQMSKFVAKQILNQMEGIQVQCGN